MQLAKESTRFSHLKMPEDMARAVQAAASLLDAGCAVRSQRSAGIDADRHPDGRHLRQRQVLSRQGGAALNQCLDLDQLSDILRTSTDPAKLLDAWRGWHTVSPPMRPLFQKYVELGNKGARELGFADMGAMWRSKYDMPRRCVPGRNGPAVGAGEAAVSFLARLRALEVAREIRRPGSRQRPHSRRICWATCGRRNGRTFIRWLRRKTPIPVTI